LKTLSTSFKSICEKSSSIICLEALFTRMSSLLYLRFLINTVSSSGELGLEGGLGERTYSRTCF
jgi:hypothetical protein